MANKVTTLIIAEVLVLQRFPYGKNSTFFYAAGSAVAVGDLVQVPWRKGLLAGVVVKTKKITAPLGTPKINLRPAVKDSAYFFSPLPDQALELKSIVSVIEKAYLKPDLLYGLKAAAERYFVSWNHFVKAAVRLPVKSRKSQTNFLPLIRQWSEKIGQESITAKNLHLKIKSIPPFVFLTPDQTSQLKSLVANTLASGQQVLVLVPEKIQTIPVAAKYAVLAKKHLSATPIILGKFLSAGAFRQAWEQARTHSPLIFVGTRGALFAPFASLGLIILEEGHDPSHKSWDMSPLYDSRELLGLIYPQTLKIYLSGTPRLQDFYPSPDYFQGHSLTTLNWNSLVQNQSESKLEPEESPYALTRTINYEGQTRKTTLINLAKDRQYTRRPAPISHYLEKKLISALKKNQSALVIANHGGFANVLICQDCQQIARCPHCGKSLALRNKSTLVCYNCGAQVNNLEHCPHCAGHRLIFSGFGLEKIKESLFKLKKNLDFQLWVAPGPEAGSQQMASFLKGISAGQNQATVILGLPGIIPVVRLLEQEVTLAAALSFDHIMFHPDFRAEEKAAARFYNLLSVAPHLYIQTADPQHPFWHKALPHAYSSFFPKWIGERKTFNFPPFSRIIKLDGPGLARIKSPVELEVWKKFPGLLAIFLVPHQKKQSNGNSLILKVAVKADPHRLINQLAVRFGKLKVNLDPEEIV